MTMMKEFDKDFVERTLEVLRKCKDETEYDVTLTLNCLLGMLTLPIERNKNGKTEEIKKFKKDCVAKLKQLKNSKDFINEKIGESQFFRDIRNSIAHLNIKVEEKPIRGEIENIIFWNNNDKGEKTMQVNISVSNLYIFAEYVAEEYLKRFYTKR